MIIPKNLSIENFTYHLPDDRIAKYPLAQRDESKLLVFNETILSDTFKNVAKYLPSPALLVTNNTKVIRARMEFYKPSGARIELFCLEPWQPTEYSQMFIQNETCSWVCYVGNSKKWKEGYLSKQLIVKNKTVIVNARRVNVLKDAQIIEFSWNHPDITFGEIIDHVGQIPIPPYLNRAAEESDSERYQTVYSKFKGSVAAPTAGLHFTSTIFEALEQNGIKQHEVTLHVGAGTFKPVQSATIGEHPMHTEHFILSGEILKPLIENSHPIIAVGTTTVRTLESMYWMGVKVLLKMENPLEIGQWESYQITSEYNTQQAFEALYNYIKQSGKTQMMAHTSVMIAPGYQFKIIKYLITNFHQPQSTLLLLIAACIGDHWKKCYEFALENNFRFLSYGDSCLIKIID